MRSSLDFELRFGALEQWREELSAVNADFQQTCCLYVARCCPMEGRSSTPVYNVVTQLGVHEHYKPK